MLTVHLKNVPMMDLSGAYAQEDLIKKAIDKARQLDIPGMAF